MDEDNEVYMERLQRYMELGVITFHGVDENGEGIYAVHEELAKEYAPELWQAHEQYIDDHMIDLFNRGLADVEYNEDLEATIHFSKEGYLEAKKLGIIPIEE